MEVGVYRIGPRLVGRYFDHGAPPAALARLFSAEQLSGVPESQHMRMLADPGVVYIVADNQAGRIAGFAILQGLLSEHKQVELKRLVVRTPNQGVGKELLTEVADRAFGEHSAHRLFLDVFLTNDRARHVYESFGFRKEGIMRDAIDRDGAHHSLVLMSLLETEYRSGSKAPAPEALKQGGTNG